MKPFSFVHAADLHLSSTLQAHLTEEQRVVSAFRNATLEAFENVIEVCIREQVDFFLVSGDVFDATSPSMASQIRFREGLALLAEHGIASYVVYGNHDSLDRLSQTLRFPPLVHVFGATPQSVVHSQEGEPLARIHGVSHAHANMADNLAAQLRRTDEPLFQIGLVHANLNGNTNHGAYAPCKTQDLQQSGLDYWALGHVHTRTVLPGPPWIVYPGNAQGRHIRETGPKGCMVVRVRSRNAVDCDFHATDTVRWANLTLAIDDIDNDDTLLARIKEIVEESLNDADGRHLAARLRLSGFGPMAARLRHGGYAQDLCHELRRTYSPRRPFAWIDAIEINVQPPIDADELRRSPVFAGELLRLGDDQGAPENLASIRELIQQELLNQRDLADILADPSDEELSEMLQEAVGLCLEHLLKDEP